MINITKRDILNSETEHKAKDLIKSSDHPDRNATIMRADRCVLVRIYKQWRVGVVCGRRSSGRGGAGPARGAPSGIVWRHLRESAGAGGVWRPAAPPWSAEGAGGRGRGGEGRGVRGAPPPRCPEDWWRSASTSEMGARGPEALRRSPARRPPIFGEHERAVRDSRTLEVFANFQLFVCLLCGFGLLEWIVCFWWVFDFGMVWGLLKSRSAVM